MFKKVKTNKKSNSMKQELDLYLEDDPELDQKGNDININKIKSEIEQKLNKNKKLASKNILKLEKAPPNLNKEESNKSSIKKVFISEEKLKEAKDPEAKKKLLGVKREEFDKIKQENKKGLVDLTKELYSLPKSLTSEPSERSNHVDNLIKLSSAGLIDLPLILGNKKSKEPEKKDSSLDNKLAEELDYLKVLKKLGPGYAQGYKSDLSHKETTKLNKIFEDVFVPENSRKRKLNREKIIEQNRKYENN